MAKNINNCLNGFVAAGRMTAEQARQILAAHNQATLQFQAGGAAGQAPHLAAVQVAQQTLAAAKRQRTLVAAHLAAVRRVDTAASTHSQGRIAGMMAFLARDIWDEARWANVDQQISAVRGTLHAMFADQLSQLRTRTFGFVQDAVTARAMVRELYGAGSGNADAAVAAKAWGDVVEYARRRFNAAGGNIAKLANGMTEWRLPQWHDAARVDRAGYSAWRQQFTAADVALMKTYHGLNDIQFEAAMQDVHETLASAGLSKVVSGRAGTGKRLAQQHQDHRFLLFADAASWLAYNDKFGAGNIFTLLTTHLEHMARDIAILETLGPNPEAVVRWMVDEARKADRAARGGQTAMQRLGQAHRLPIQLFESPEMIRSTWEVITGRVNQVADSELSELVAAAAAGTRNLLQAAQLGSAPLSAVTDFQFINQTKAWNNLDAVKAMRWYLSTLNPADEEARRFAVAQGLIADAWVHRAAAAKRFADETIGSGWTARVADSSHRLSGLTQHTSAAKYAFGLTMQNVLGERVGRAFADLDEPLRRSMERYGVTARMWDLARRRPPVTFRGAPFVDLMTMARAGSAEERGAADSILRMIHSETNFAVPEPDARVRGALLGGALGGQSRRGTFAAEMWRSTAMYKSFSVSVLATHGMRALAPANVGRPTGHVFNSRGWVFGSLLVGLTVMGGFALQMRQIALGKDPRDMTTPEFWAAALIAGGGLGFLGDFIYSASSSNDQTLPQMALGPATGLAIDLARVPFASVREAFAGEDLGWQAELIRFAGTYAPGSSLWYARLATDRLLQDQLSWWADPNAARGFARIERRAARDFGQAFFWRPGEALPDRAPDLGAAMGGSR